MAEDLTLVEGVQKEAGCRLSWRDHKMGREADASYGEPLAAGDFDVQNAQADGQALFGSEQGVEQGMFRVIVVVPRAAEAEGLKQVVVDAGDRFDAIDVHWKKDSGRNLVQGGDEAIDLGFPTLLGTEPGEGLVEGEVIAIGRGQRNEFGASGTSRLVESGVWGEGCKHDGSHLRLSQATRFVHAVERSW